MMDKRPLVCVTDVDSKIYPLGGNMRLKALKELGYKEIKKEWVTLADDWTIEKQKEFLIKDNVSFGAWDWDMLANEWDAEELESWGVDIWNESTDEINNDDNDEKYTRKIESPIYEPSDEMPNINEIYNNEKYLKLLSEIEKSNVPIEVKTFLKHSASRHIIFNYKKIADYYSGATIEVQQLMENSALVIIDFEKAVELGYVKLSDGVIEEYINTYDKTDG